MYAVLPVRCRASRFSTNLVACTASVPSNMRRLFLHPDDQPSSQVRGIGRWTADMFAMFHLGRPDVLPVGDLGVRKGFQILYGLKVSALTLLQHETAALHSATFVL